MQSKGKKRFIRIRPQQMKEKMVKERAADQILSLQLHPTMECSNLAAVPHGQFKRNEFKQINEGNENVFGFLLVSCAI